MSEIAHIVQEILNAEDIEGLLGLGAPSDEYAKEAELVGIAVQRLVSLAAKGGLGPVEVAKTIRGVWACQFGPLSEQDLDKRQPGFERVAIEIVHKLEAR